MRRTGLFMVLMIVGSVSPSRAADRESSNIELGGPRQASAVITTLDNDFHIAVRMLPVKAFDPTTNSLLNRDKARGFALQALARHLSGLKTGEVRLSVSGATTVQAEQDGLKFLLVLRVPRDHVALRSNEAPKRGEKTTAAKQPKTADSTETVSDASTLLTCKQDYQNTVESLSNNLRDELTSVEEKLNADEAAFDEAIANLEETLDARWERLRLAIEQDKLLLNLERKELLTAVQIRHEQLLGALRQAVEGRDEQQAKSKKATP